MTLLRLIRVPRLALFSRPLTESQPTPLPPEPASDDRLASLFVWGIWFLMTVLAVRLVARYGVGLPFDDEWVYTGILSGQEPLSWNFLWAQHNEHRIPVPRLVYFALHWLTGNEFRAPMFFSVGMLAIASAMLIGTAKRLRGSLHWSDAFLPVILLQASHADNLIWSFQLPFTIGTCLVSYLLLLASQHGTLSSRSLSLRLTLCLALLAGCGANGIAFLPAGIAWLGWLAWRYRESRLLHLLEASVLIALFVAYFYHFQKSEHHATTRSMTLMAKAFVQLLAIGVGLAVNLKSGPLPSLWLPVGSTLAVGLFTAVASLLVRSIRGDRRATALLFAAAGGLSLLVGMSYGRAAVTDDPGLTPRYITLSVPVLAFVYLAWLLCLQAHQARFIQVVMGLGMALLFLQNQESGSGLAQHRHTALHSTLAEIRHEVPAPFVIDRILATCAYPPWIPHTRKSIEDLIHAQVGIFGRIAATRNYEERETPVTITARNCELQDGFYRALSPDAELRVILPERVKIVGIRWEYELHDPFGYRPDMNLGWKDGTEVKNRTIWQPLHCTGQPASSRLWIDDTVTEFSLRIFKPNSRIRPQKIFLIYEKLP